MKRHRRPPYHRAGAVDNQIWLLVVQANTFLHATCPWPVRRRFRPNEWRKIQGPASMIQGRVLHFRQPETRRLLIERPLDNMFPSPSVYPMLPGYHYPPARRRRRPLGHPAHPHVSRAPGMYHHELYDILPSRYRAAAETPLQ